MRTTFVRSLVARGRELEIETGGLGALLVGLVAHAVGMPDLIMTASHTVTAA